MALKALMLRRNIDLKKASLAELTARDKEFTAREAELETAIGEAVTQEDQDTVSAAVVAFDADMAAHEAAKATLQGEINDLETQLASEEAAQPAPPASPNERNDKKTMPIRTKFFGLSPEERDAFFADSQVKNLLEEVRACIREKRALTNVGLTIPRVSLGILREQVAENSKLISLVDLRPLRGEGRMTVAGSIPEAVWTEACATLNELDLVFNGVEVDGYKVGGLFVVCNAVLEDSDADLMTELLTSIGRAIGKAVDKAIVYGTGVKMPLGIVTRLAQTAAPTNYPATARAWKDLHTSNIIKGTGATGLNLFKEIATNSGAAITDYSAGAMTWMMNRKTHLALQTQSMDKNLNAAIVAGIDGSMPVIGGNIVDLNFIPDNNIVFGYLDLYLLAERAGTKLESSREARFFEDQTVFRGTARYDGLPVIAEAFGVMTITTAAPTTSVTFPADKANTPASDG